MPLATPEQIASGYWDRCPHCDRPVYLPIAGGKDSKSWVRCPSCTAAIKPDC